MVIKKNILVLASTFPRSRNDSVPEFVLDLSKQLSGEFDITVLAPHDSGARYRETLDGVDIWRFPYFIPGLETLAYRGGMVNLWKKSFLAKIQLPFFLLFELLFTLYLIRAKQIRLIQAHWLFPQGWIAYLVSRLSGVNYIVTTHGADVAILKSKPVAKFLRPVLTNSAFISFVSRLNQDFVQATYPGLELTQKAAVIPMGVYLPEVLPPSRHRKTKLLFIGRLVAIKGVDYLLKAIPQIKKRDDIELDILGDGPMKNEWENLTNQLGLSQSVNFRGYTTGDLKHQFLRHADVVVVPSIIDSQGYQEGLPVVALEALAFGKILIATATGGLTELISDGHNGFLVPPSNSQAIADTINKILADPDLCKYISSQAVKTSKNYSWKNIGQKFSALINNIL
jgi:glycosyltransferase involved in cell wall biosynthesis